MLVLAAACAGPGPVPEESADIITAKELRVGTRVQAWFTGPVLRSYPAQATARQVVIKPEP